MERKATLCFGCSKGKKINKIKWGYENRGIDY